MVVRWVRGSTVCDSANDKRGQSTTPYDFDVSSSSSGLAESVDDMSISQFQSPSDNDTLTPINQLERESGYPSMSHSACVERANDGVPASRCTSRLRLRLRLSAEFHCNPRALYLSSHTLSLWPPHFISDDQFISPLTPSAPLHSSLNTVSNAHDTNPSLWP